MINFYKYCNFKGSNGELLSDEDNAEATLGYRYQ